ncbi:MAG: WD40 repeat domain-containing protein, partial [Pseudomonadota bacterium]
LNAPSSELEFADESLAFKQVAFAPADRLLGSNMNGLLYVWDAQSGGEAYPPVSGLMSSDLLSLSVSPGGERMAAAGSNGKVTLLELQSDATPHTAFEGDEEVFVVAFTPEGEEIVGGDRDGALRRWDVSAAKLLAVTVRGHSLPIIDLARSEDGQIWATLGRDQQLRLWRAGLPTASVELDVSEGQRAKGVAFSPDGNILGVGDRTGRLTLWQWAQDAEPKTLQAHSGEIWAVAFAPEGDMIATGDRNGEVAIWELSTGRRIDRRQLDEEPVWSLEFFPDSGRLMMATSSTVRVLDIESGAEETLTQLDSAPLNRASLSPSGDRIAAALSNGTIAVLDAADGSLLREIKADDNALWSATFDPSGERIISASSDEVVVVWDADEGTSLAVFGGHSGGATDAKILADGTTVVAVDRAGTIHFWDIETNRRLADPHPAHSRASWRIASHPDGVRFATSGDDGRAVVSSQLDFASICRVSAESFDAARREQYLGTEETPVGCP